MNPDVIGDANAAATLRGPKSVLPLVVLSRGTPRARFPSAGTSSLQVFGFKFRHSPLPPVAGNAPAEQAPASPWSLRAIIMPGNHVMLIAELRSIGRPGGAGPVMTLRLQGPLGAGALKTKLWEKGGRRNEGG